MTEKILLLPIIIPLLAGLAILLIGKKFKIVQNAILLPAVLVNLILSVKLFGSNLSYILPWPAREWDFILRSYSFSNFIVIFIALFGFLIALYSAVSLKDKNYARNFHAYFLITLSFANGVALADNLLLLLFFWEGLLLTIFAMIYLGGKKAFRTAIKAFIIIGVTDLCMLLGIALVNHLSGTLVISKISLTTGGLASLAFILLMIGAISKGGSMPMHSWIPDAAVDAPLPFMAILPAALEKLLGIYLLTRICLDMFKLQANSWLSILLMSIGGLTIILAVMMALIQKDYKRLLSYHAISQVGYMILGIGTCVPAGIVGGLFHMVNNALYKSGLFLSGGCVEKQTGTTNLEKLGGLAKMMPVTFISYLVLAASISGVPPFNGFFSKELIYDGALERGRIFYFMAVLGSFFTAASFLKLGHAAFLGKLKMEHRPKEAPLVMLLPMVVIAIICVVFGVYNFIPLNKFIQPVLGEHILEGHNYSGMPANMSLVVITIIVLVVAILNHLWGVRIKGSGLKAADHIHYAPVLFGIYNKAGKRFFDPYDIGLKLVSFISGISWYLDKGIDWLYNNLSVKTAFGFSAGLRRLHSGNYSLYILWSLIGAAAVLVYLLKGF